MTEGPRRQVPHDATAEQALLGAMMLSRDALAVGVEQSTAEDFYRPAHAAIFAALVNLHGRGDPADAVTLSDELARLGQLELVGGLPALVELQSNCPSTTNVAKYAQILARHTLARNLIRLGLSMADEAQDPATDPADLIESVTSELGGLHQPHGSAPADLTAWDTFWDRAPETYKPWAIPSILRIGWRAVLVATEGAGKTVISSQIALLASQGIHPFTFEQITPIRTLVVNLENPEDYIDLTGEMFRPRLQTVLGDSYVAENAWLLHRPGGLNLRSRAGHNTLESAMAYVRPQLLVVAPVYKMYRRTKGESDEEAAADVQMILDDLRTRYGCALLLEHHVPKKVASNAREMVPFGSSLWLRWPELGIACTAKGDQGDLIVGRYRPDRMPCCWPDELHRGRAWPWIGWYAQGIAQPEIEPVF